MFLGETKQNAKQKGQEKASIGIAGLFAAFLYLFPFLGLPFGTLFSALTPLPLLYLGFQHGFRPMLLSGLVALLGIAASGQVELALNFVLSTFGMVAITGFFLFRKQNKKPLRSQLGRIIFGLSCYAGFILVVNQVSMEPQDRILENVQEIYKQLGVSNFNQIMSEENKQMLLKMTRYLPGMMTSVWLIVFVGLLFLAQNLYTQKAKRLPFLRMTQIRLPDGCFYLFLISCLGNFLSTKALADLSTNATILFAIPFLLRGLSKIHGLIEEKIEAIVQRRFLRIAFYVISFVFPWVLFCIAFYGLYLFLKDRSFFRPFKVVKK